MHPHPGLDDLRDLLRAGRIPDLADALVQHLPRDVALEALARAAVAAGRAAWDTAPLEDEACPLATLRRAERVVVEGRRPTGSVASWHASTVEGLFRRATYTLAQEASHAGDEVWAAVAASAWHASAAVESLTDPQFDFASLEEEEWLEWLGLCRDSAEEAFIAAILVAAPGALGAALEEQLLPWLSGAADPLRERVQVERDALDHSPRTRELISRSMGREAVAGLGLRLTPA